MESTSDDAPETRTFTQRGRRAQIVDVTVQLVAEKGYAGISLSGIAERAGITKPAVLYHFRSKAAVVEAAYQEVLQRLVGRVGQAVEEAAADEGAAAYIRSMVAYLDENPTHTRMIIEALSNQDTELDTASRWRPLAELIEAARAARGLDPDPDARTTAIVVGGGIDGIVAEKLQDPEYDSAAAAEHLIRILEGAWRA
ncbi:TetR/AcrR family transcriptional regulator [Sediminivirga luteola]|uniref:TetR/AcrR family transcriptional regulator n=1 Tax=Sediminivirga luteola TaxID=1774748 RepID=UPI001F5AC9AD|nr:TetR/AcrR family transcriptional regulator [Sediminivirga luteola]MCI2264946.1 TetR/AcrR family transcriptional regulator [Sediminivirga luteola]